MNSAEAYGPPRAQAVEHLAVEDGVDLPLHRRIEGAPGVLDHGQTRSAISRKRSSRSVAGAAPAGAPQLRKRSAATSAGMTMALSYNGGTCSRFSTGP